MTELLKPFGETFSCDCFTIHTLLIMVKQLFPKAKAEQQSQSLRAEIRAAEERSKYLNLSIPYQM